MEKVKEFIKNDLFRAALFFCAIEFSFALLVELTDINGSISFWAMLELFAFSLVLSVGMRLFKVNGLPFLLALILHYAISLFSAYVIFCILGRIANVKGMILLVSLAYAIVAVVVIIINRFNARKTVVPEKTKKKSKKNSYTKQFK